MVNGEGGFYGKSERELETIIEDGMQAFFTVVKNAYPECKSGDFPPDAHFEFSSQCREALEVWVEANY